MKWLSLQTYLLTYKLKTMVNVKQNKVEEPSIRVNLCEFDYIFANLFADLQTNNYFCKRKWTRN